jgi:hypothetical protein
MPQLSLAATGSAPGMEPTQVSAQTSSVPPPPGPRKAWQVSGATAPARALAPAAPPTREPRPQAAAASSPVQVQVVPAPARVPEPAAAPAEVESDPWRQVTSDTEDLTAQVDTPARAGARPRPSGLIRLAAAQEGRRFWRVAALVTVIVAGLLIGAGFVFGWFTHLFGGRHEVTARPPLKVSRDAAQGAFRSIHQALQSARPGDRILLLDPEYREQVRLQGSKYRDIHIEPGPGVQVVWKAPAKTAHSLLVIDDVAGVHVKGITFNGEDRVDKLVRLGGFCPGVALEQVTLEGFTQSALSIANCAGEPKRPVEVRELVVRAPAKDAESAVLFGGSPKMRPPRNDHIRFSGCRFEGTYKGSAVRFPDPKGPPLMGPDVQVPR